MQKQNIQRDRPLTPHKKTIAHSPTQKPDLSESFDVSELELEISRR
ncbi:hypothetical protein [Pseudanabaena sp. UWO311]|nr:hypothetical protein [Pseudanabaena sp. UWO311]